MTSQADLAKLFQTGGKSIGLDEKASSTLIANLDRTTTPMCIGQPLDPDEMETDDFRLVFFGLDSSSSMEDVQDDVRDCFNEIIMPGLLGGAKPQVGAIRFGGLTFASTVSPLWKAGWHPLSDKFPLLTPAEYRADGSTALHKGILDGVTAATSYALQLAAKTGTHPEVVFAYLTDGANNQPPQDVQSVADVVTQLSRELFTTVFIYFETYERVDGEAIGKALGFSDVMSAKAKPGETKDEMRRRFRHTMKVFSDKLISRASTSRVGQSVPKTGSTGFWN